MKSSIPVMVCFILMIGIQNESISQNKFALMGGATYSSFSMNSSGGADQDNFFVTHFFAGAGLEHNLTKKWKLNGFLQYAQKGSKVDVTFLLGDFSSAYKIHSIDLLPTIEYSLIEQLGIYAGGSLGYNFKTTLNTIANGKTFSNDYTHVTKDFSTGIVLGTRFYAGRMAIHAHWNKEFTEIVDLNLTNEKGETVNNTGYSKNTIQVGVSFYL